ncbi:MAG: M50 family metallopeptidase [Anaerolineae bacterium]
MRQLKTLFNLPPGERFTTRQMLALIGLAGLAAALITWLPLLNIFNYPFRLLLTIVHELGHGLAGLLTGGSFRNFVIAPDGSGLAYTAGGWRFVIIPAGYLGVALFAAALIVAGRRHRWGRAALGLTGAAMIVLTLCYARPGGLSIPAIINSALTMMMGVIFGALFVRIALKSTPAAVVFFLHLIAIKAGFTAFADIWAVIGLSTQAGPVPRTDAHSMAELTHIPAVVWGGAWVVMALIFIGGAVWVAWGDDGG